MPMFHSGSGSAQDEANAVNAEVGTVMDIVCAGHIRAYACIDE